MKPITMYSILEQHVDGSWWYHPGCTFSTQEEAALRAASFGKPYTPGFYISRPFRILAHTKPFPQDMSRCTHDFVHFDFAGGWEFSIEEGEK